MANQHSRLPITSLAEAQGYIEHLEEQLQATLEESAEHERSAARLEREKAGLIEQLEALQQRWDQTMNYLGLQIEFYLVGDDTAKVRLLESVAASLTGDGSYPAMRSDDE